MVRRVQRHTGRFRPSVADYVSHCGSPVCGVGDGPRLACHGALRSLGSVAGLAVCPPVLRKRRQRASTFRRDWSWVRINIVVTGEDLPIVKMRRLIK